VLVDAIERLGERDRELWLLLESDLHDVARRHLGSGRFAERLAGIAPTLAGETHAERIAIAQWSSSAMLGQARTAAEAASLAEQVATSVLELELELPGPGSLIHTLIAAESLEPAESVIELMLDRARTWAERELAAASEWDTPRAIGVARFTLGLITGGAAVIEHLQQATATLEDSPARLELAHALVELGAAQRRANQRNAAREPLGRGMSLAAQCGADALAERAREELRATGARPRRLTLSGLDALTPASDALPNSLRRDKPISRSHRPRSSRPAPSRPTYGTHCRS
jgi:hypothetical protein